MRKWIQHGAEMRNRLIHRPGEPTPDRQHASDYVSAVVAALYHLMSLLYPDDATLKDIAADRRRLPKLEKGPPPLR